MLYKIHLCNKRLLALNSSGYNLLMLKSLFFSFFFFFFLWLPIQLDRLTKTKCFCASLGLFTTPFFKILLCTLLQRKTTYTLSYAHKYYFFLFISVHLLTDQLIEINMMSSDVLFRPNNCPKPPKGQQDKEKLICPFLKLEPVHFFFFYHFS